MRMLRGVRGAGRARISDQAGPGIVHTETRGFNQRDERVIVLQRKFLVPKQAR